QQRESGIRLRHRLSPAGNVAVGAVIAQLSHYDRLSESGHQIVAWLQNLAKGTVAPEIAAVVFLETKHRKAYCVRVAVTGVVFGKVAVALRGPHEFCLHSNRVGQLVKSSVGCDVIFWFPPTPGETATRILHFLAPSDRHGALQLTNDLRDGLD